MNNKILNKDTIINFFILITIPLILSILYIYIDSWLNYTNFLWIHQIFNSWIIFNIYFADSNLSPHEQIIFLIFILFIKYIIVYLYVTLLKIKNSYKYMISFILGLLTAWFWYLFFNIMMSV